MIPARILGTAHLLPGPAISSAEVAEHCFPGKGPERLIAATGIRKRHWAPAGTTTTELGAAVVAEALKVAGLPASALERVIFVSTMGGDWLGPSTATAILDVLGINGQADGFDLMNACVGLLTGLDIAARSVATGSGPVAVVSVELASRFVDPRCPRTYGLFGDAAAAVILGPSTDGSGFRASHLSNDYAAGPTIAIQHPGGHNVPLDFRTTSTVMTGMAVQAICGAVEKALKKGRLQRTDLDWILPHQPNGQLLAEILKALQVDPDRIDVHVGETGSLASASVGVSLDRLWKSGKLKEGDRILIASVGSPLAAGALIYEHGQAGAAI